MAVWSCLYLDCSVCCLTAIVLILFSTWRSVLHLKVDFWYKRFDDLSQNRYSPLLVVFPYFYFSTWYEYLSHLCRPSTSPCLIKPFKFCLDADWLPPCFPLLCQTTGLRQFVHMGVRWRAAQSGRRAQQRTRGDVRGDKCCSFQLTLGRGRGSAAVAWRWHTAPSGLLMGIMHNQFRAPPSATGHSWRQ